MPTSNGDSGWLDFLEEQKGWPTAYSAYWDWGKTPSQKKYFQGRFADVEKQFMGQQARQIWGGGAPSLRFTDFLSQYFAPQGGAAQEWAGMTPRQKGFDFGRFSPPTRWRV